MALRQFSVFTEREALLKKRAIKTHGSNRKKPGLKTQVNSEKGEFRAPCKTIFDISYLCLH